MSDKQPIAAILTLGCKLNIADSEAMVRRLREAGWTVTGQARDADAVIVNTCSVTGMADQKSRRLARLARRVAPEATVALTGCLLETAPADKIDTLNADLVYRQPDQIALADKLIESIGAGPSADEAEAQAPARRAFKTRAFISAQEGCNDVCAFCIIPKTRGRERSKAVDWVVEQARLREAEGVQEVVITGTQLGHYGRDTGGSGVPPMSNTDTNLEALLRGLLEGTSIPRIRMSSVQPQDLSEGLIDLWRTSEGRLCRHFHLALQSGSEGVLKRMRRRYTAGEYRTAVHRLRDAIPGVAITTDVIAGFPGETEAEFEESYVFCEEMAFAGIHVFPYSQRSGTVAYNMARPVPDTVKKQRVRRLLDLGSEMARTYRGGFLDSTASVLWETRPDGNTWEGLTDTYMRVHTEFAGDLANRLTPVRITSLGNHALLGEVTA